MHCILHLYIGHLHKKLIADTFFDYSNYNFFTVFINWLRMNITPK